MRSRFDTQSNFDTQGLFFGLKFLAVLIGLFALAYGGGQLVGERVFGSDTIDQQADDALAQARLHHALLTSVKEANRILAEDDELGDVSRGSAGTYTTAVIKWITGNNRIKAVFLIGS